jgi:hypothetical protein
MFADHMPESGDGLSATYVRRLLEEHRAGRDHTARLWRVLAFQVWRREALVDATRVPAAMVR